MADKFKRGRGPNFKADEKNVLLSLINEHIDVIENKKTDLVSSLNKVNAWRKITHQFNNMEITSSYRNDVQLKNFYENMKRRTKRLAANDKMCEVKIHNEDEAGLEAVVIFETNDTPSNSKRRVATSTTDLNSSKRSESWQNLKKFTETKVSENDLRVQQMKEKHDIEMKILAKTLELKEIECQMKKKELENCFQ